MLTDTDGDDVAFLSGSGFQTLNLNMYPFCDDESDFRAFDLNNHFIPSQFIQSYLKKYL